MPTYKIDGKDYNAIDLQRDISLYIGIDIEKLRILEDAKRKGLLSANPSQYMQEKVKFLKAHYWGNLNGNNGSVPVEECKPERINAVVTKEIRKLLDSNVGRLEVTVSEVEAAKKRVAEYSRLDADAFKREQEQARIALENFKREEPAKYSECVIAAIRA